MAGREPVGVLDLSGPYRKTFNLSLPDAVQVADPFHVVKVANTVTLAEAAEAFHVDLSNLVGAATTDPRGTITILNRTV